MPVVNARHVIDSCAGPPIVAMAVLGNGVPFVMQTARFFIGQIVRHRIYPFRGVIFDVDPTFDNTEEWYQAIPEDIRPRKDQPFYHLFAENEETEYVAYCSEQNLVPDDSGQPVRSAAAIASGAALAIELADGTVDAVALSDSAGPKPAKVKKPATGKGPATSQGSLF